VNFWNGKIDAVLHCISVTAVLVVQICQYFEAGRVRVGVGIKLRRGLHLFHKVWPIKEVYMTRPTNAQHRASSS
jgi:hypothetical protein